MYLKIELGLFHYWKLKLVDSRLKYTIRSNVCEASCHPVTQSPSHLVTQ